MHDTLVGPLCELSETGESESIRQTCKSYEEYISSLNSTCQAGEPGRLIWTPDDDTPNLVYYQVCVHVHDVKESIMLAFITTKIKYIIIYNRRERENILLHILQCKCVANN